MSNRLPLEPSYMMGPQLGSETGDACTVHTGAGRHVQSSSPGTLQPLTLHGPEGKVHNVPDEHGGEMPQNNKVISRSHTHSETSSLLLPSLLPDIDRLEDLSL